MGDTRGEEIPVRASGGNLGMRERLREKIRAGMQSGFGIPADEVFSRLEAKYQAMIER